MSAIRKKFLLAVGMLFCALFSTLSYAHSGHDGSVSFMSGLFHPFSGIDHFLVILLIGFWSAFVLNRFLLGPVAFIVGMFLGVIAGLVNISFEFFEFGIAASVIAIGLLLMVKKYSSKLVLPLILVFGIFHGFAHANLFSNTSAGVALISQDLIGLLLATGFLHLSGSVLAKLIKDKASLFSKIAGLSGLGYGGVLMYQLIFALVGGVSA